MLHSWVFEMNFNVHMLLLWTQVWERRRKRMWYPFPFRSHNVCRKVYFYCTALGTSSGHKNSHRNPLLNFQWGSQLLLSKKCHWNKSVCVLLPLHYFISKITDQFSVISHCLVSNNRRCWAACWWAAYRPCPHAMLSPACADGARCAEWLGGLSPCMSVLDVWKNTDFILGSINNWGTTSLSTPPYQWGQDSTN